MKKKTWILFFLSVYGFGALSTTQTIPWIKENGFDAMQQGILLASVALFTIGLQIVFGILSDRTAKMKIYFFIVFAGALAASVWMYFQKIDSFWLMFVLIGGIGGSCRCYQSMIDTWGLESSDASSEFEKDKAIGSVGWALGAWVAALVLNWLDFTALGWVCAFCGIASLVFCVKLKDVERQSTMKWSQLKQLASNKEYVVLVLIMLVLFSMGCADIYLVVDKMMSLGGTSFHVGLKWGLQSLAEAPVFLISKKLLERFQMIPLLIFSTLMFGVRFLIYGFVQNVWILVLCSLMQSVTFPIAIYCTKIGIDQCTGEEIKSTSQLAGASIYMGISLLVMPVLTSWLASHFNQDIALFCVAGSSVFALYLIQVYRKINS
ncbi:MAG: MFS transporter [Erysipelotrichaceae bacterium]|nr:MFS transporter [Erysipelotrichaceae bacterium]